MTMLKKGRALLDRFVAVSPSFAQSEPGNRASPPVEAPDLIAAATEAQGRRDWDTAHRLWSAASDTRPDDINCWLQLGNMRNELGRYAAAATAFERAQTLDRLAAEPLIGVAGVHERAGDWDAALAAWNAVARLIDDAARPGRSSDPSHLAHALEHATISAAMTGQRSAAQELMLEASQRIPGFADRPRNLLLRAQHMRDADPARARELLTRCLAQTPDDDAARFELGSLALDHGEPEHVAEAADTVEASLARRGRDLSFLWLLADLRERLRDWTSVRLLSEQMAALNPADRRYMRRAFDAAIAMKDWVAARRLARAVSKTTDGSVIISDLAGAYEEAGELDHARLLFRFLKRRWPLKDKHTLRLVTLTAARRSLAEADRLMRAEIIALGRNIERDRAYCNAAFRSGDYAEARRRFEWFCSEHLDDEEGQAALGYAIANTAGFAEAERHFSDFAARSFQTKIALVGLAHMAMRRRELEIAHERWGKIVALYPDDTIARVEYARSAYEVRDVALALKICEEQLRKLPSDVTMGGFYAWLLVAIGRFVEAATFLKRLSLQTGPDWAVVELSLQSAAQAGVLDAEFPRICDKIPIGGGPVEARRLYHAIRQLWAARRNDLLQPLVSRVAIDPRHLGWLAPYLTGNAAKAGIGPPLSADFRARARTAWERTRGAVREDIAERLTMASDADIANLLDQPRETFPTVHIVNKFEQARGGSELHALDVAARLRKYANVALWAPEAPHPHFTESVGVVTIAPSEGRIPEGGVLVMIGVYFDIASFIGRARPRRVIFLYNTFEAPLLFERIREVYELTGVRSEILYCSEMMKREVDLPGFFEPSPVDIALFHPRAAPRERPFTVGRHSRDVVEKHHPQDWKVYAAAADAGGRTRLLGGRCMESVFPKTGHIEFLPSRSDRIVEFLQDIDCYYYNTSTWIEPWGRVVIEAMACGLPVLASDTGGYAEAIEHGRNGLLFRDIDEAVTLMRELAADPDLRRRLGAEARRTAESLLGAPAMARLAAFYLAGDED
jgi:glycosyltransferase involved in cell wall biosynthesis/tetratricopeptide (TPR) repeat protein